MMIGYFDIVVARKKNADARERLVVELQRQALSDTLPTLPQPVRCLDMLADVDRVADLPGRAGAGA